MSPLETESLEVVANTGEPPAELLRAIYCPGCRVHSEVYRVNGGTWQRFVAHEVHCARRP